MEEKTTYNSRNAKWWLPNKTEFIMLTVATLTLIVSILTQATNAINNLLRFDEIYTDLYPVLNAAHLLVILYVIYKIQYIKQLLPETDKKNIDTNYERRAKDLRLKLKTWMENYVGKFYYKEKRDKFIEEQIKTANKNINQLYNYWGQILAWLFIVYTVEFINSLTPKDEQELLSLVIIFNNITTVYWFFIYLKLNLSDRAQTENNKITGSVNKCIYWLNHVLGLSFAFGKDFKKSEKNITGYKITALILFGIFSAVLIYFIICGKEINDTEYKVVMYISILLGSCSMLAAFSRLGCGTLGVPVSALLLMLFYSAVQPLFFAERELDNVDKSDQLLFIINLICLIGKFALLYIIKWVFSDYRIAHYFINEQIIKNKTIEDNHLKEIFP
jgi:hypothetical protein